MNNDKHYSAIPWGLLFAIFWSFLWRSTLITLGVMTFVRLGLYPAKGNDTLGRNKIEDIALVVVSIVSWFLSLKWSIEKYLGELSDLD